MFDLVNHITIEDIYMIDENITFILFGYTSNTLKPHSHKKVLRVCNCCREERLIRYGDCTKLCIKCSRNTKEYKHKMSKNMMGKHPTEETKQKMSKARIGTHPSEETRAKISKSLIGKHRSEETKLKLSEANSGNKHPQWKGGKKLSFARRDAKRRKLFRFIPHNLPQENFHGHHLDFNHVIFIPKELHTSIYHSVIKNINMEEINDIACDWYLEYQLI